MDVSEQIRANLQRGHQQAIEFQGSWWEWADLARIADGVIRRLRAAGVPDNALIGVIARTRPQHGGALLGLVADRRSISIIHAYQSPEALGNDIRARRMAAVIGDVSDWSDAAKAAAREVGTLGIGLTGDRADPVVTVVEAGPETTARGVTVAEPVFELITSGTTGTPKRMPFRFPVIAHAVMSVVPGLRSEPDAPPHINFWPFSHVGGLCNLFAFGVQGIRLSLLEKFTVEGYVDVVRRYRPTVGTLTPTAARMILDAKIPREDLSSIRMIFGGSARLDPEIQDEFEAVYGIPILWGYGATEFGGSAASWTPALREKFGTSKRASVGCALPGVEIRVVDPETGAVLPQGREGVLEAKIPVVGPDWIHTTDLAVVDEDGFVFLKGRNDGAIVRGGFKILPERLAEALRRHDSVADAAVVGIPDRRLGQVPVAAVELRPGAAPVTAAELQEHVRKLMPPTHIPTEIRIVPALPRTQSQKANMGEVRRLFGA
jgi:acyl-coenzyme A synthetase/AMP-(fatty) acid ligase